MLARLALAALASLSACVPELESRTVETPYPLSNFDGPDSMPAPPEGTLAGIAMAGPWRIVSVERFGGEPTLDHLFRPGWFLLLDQANVSSIQGVPPEWLLPAGNDWRLNRVNEDGVALGFGFSKPRGNLNFLHYAFVAAADDINHARAIEAMHFEDARFGIITWAIWSIELERVQRPPVVVEQPRPPQWPE